MLSNCWLHVWQPHDLFVKEVAMWNSIQWPRAKAFFELTMRFELSFDEYLMLTVCQSLPDSTLCSRLADNFS